MIYHTYPPHRGSKHHGKHHAKEKRHHHHTMHHQHHRAHVEFALANTANVYHRVSEQCDMRSPSGISQQQQQQQWQRYLCLCVRMQVSQGRSLAFAVNRGIIGPSQHSSIARDR
uniref:Uncharacterized protein n=1 Tax=Vespula pensylvanica TaxID=30213 RepID=A0A834P149_VESPE|nr:hypothetical protein H0235_009109 [Vespula pensylvanica]